MKTEELVDLLAGGGGAVEPVAATRRLAGAISLGLLGAAALMMMFLGVRDDLAHGATGDVMFWVKVAFAAAGALVAVIAVSRLSRPGARLASLPAVLAAPLVAVWVLAAFALINATPGTRAALVLGDSWLACPLGITLLSAPLFVAVLWAMKGLAPTRLALAGAAAGLVSGTLGALVYALHCPEVAAPFIGTWYVVGMMIPTGVGALIGPRILRW